MLLETRFSHLWHRLGGRTDHHPLFAALAAAYSEPHRAYHNACHIAECLAEFDAVRELASRPDEVEMALWWHDAIYNPRAADNEEKSAEWMAAELSAGGVSAEVVYRISQLILATTHRLPPDDPDARIVVDVDLSRLGYAPAIFDEHAQAIRTEYAWVPEADYRQGRTRILSAFLQWPFIYQTDYFRQKYEEQARENLKRAIERLAF